MRVQTAKLTTAHQVQQASQASNSTLRKGSSEPRRMKVRRKKTMKNPRQSRSNDRQQQNHLCQTNQRLSEQRGCQPSKKHKVPTRAHPRTRSKQRKPEPPSPSSNDSPQLFTRRAYSKKMIVTLHSFLRVSVACLMKGISASDQSIRLIL